MSDGMESPFEPIGGAVLAWSDVYEPSRRTTMGMLSGMRVVEGSAFVAAPSGAMHLALLGADVIRFDPIGGGIDYTRWPLAPGGASLYWTALNKGKRSIQLELGTAEGREIAQNLITAPGDQAGMFLTNFPARGWLDYEALARKRSDLIMIAITGSPDGSSAVDYTVNASVGYPAVTGPAGSDAPVNHVLPAWDVICGQQAALGLLAAERHRQRTGSGQLVTLALSDVAMSTVANLGHVAEAEILGEQRARLGNDLYGAFGRDFVSADGQRFIVVAISLKQWTGMLDAFGITAAVAEIESTRGVDFSDEGARFIHRDALFPLVESATAQRTMTDIAASLNAQGCCWGLYQDFLTMVRDDVRCSTANPMFARVDQPGVGSVLSRGISLAVRGRRGTAGSAGSHPRSAHRRDPQRATWAVRRRDRWPARPRRDRLRPQPLPKLSGNRVEVFIDRDHTIGVLDARLDVPVVHRGDCRVPLLVNTFGCAPSLYDVSLNAASKADLGGDIDEHGHRGVTAHGIEPEQMNALGDDVPMRLNSHSGARPRVSGEVIDRHIDRIAADQPPQFGREKIDLEGIGMVEVDVRPLVGTEMREVSVVGVDRQVSRLVAETTQNLAGQRGLSGSRPSGDHAHLNWSNRHGPQAIGVR